MSNTYKDVTLTDKHLQKSRRAEREAESNEVGAERAKQRFFLLACLVLVPFTALFVKENLAHFAALRAARPDYALPSVYDLDVTLWALLVLVPARYFLSRGLFRRLGDKLVRHKPSWTQARVDRFGTVTFKFVYFVVVSLWGFRILKDAPFMPKSLGGSGAAVHAFDDYPFPDHLPQLKAYYQVELAYHIQSLLFHIVSEHRNDYLEMMLHHTTAVLLVLFSYFCNFVNIGALVLLVHDVADVAGYAVKMSVDTGYTIVTLSIYVTLLAVWGYTRLFVFPLDIIAAITEARPACPPEYYMSYNWSYLHALLVVLLFLHIYWYVLFIYMGYSYIVTGVTHDLQQHIGESVSGARLDAKAAERGKKTQ